MTAECPTGLRASAEQRALTTSERVADGIALCRERGQEPSLRKITANEHELRPSLRRLAESTILNNPDAETLYRAAQSRPRRAPRPPRVRDPCLERRTKAQLIDLIHALRGELAQTRLCLENLAFADGEGPEDGPCG